MTATKEPTTVTTSAQQRSNGVMVLFVVAVLAVVSIAAWVLIRSDDEATPTDVVQDLAAAMRAEDMDAVAAIVPDEESFKLLEWNVAMKAEPAYSDIVETPSGEQTIVNFTVTFGDDYFYSQVLDQTLETSMSGYVDEDGIFNSVSFPPPSGLTNVELDFRPWVEANHPELYDLMYEEGGWNQIRMDWVSGETRLDLLDEYMASLN